MTVYKGGSYIIYPSSLNVQLDVGSFYRLKQCIKMGGSFTSQVTSLLDGH